MKTVFIYSATALLTAGALAFGVTYFKKPVEVAAASEVVRVSLLNDQASPSAVSVEKGKYVQFDTKDNKTHNIGQGSGDETDHESHIKSIVGDHDSNQTTESADHAHTEGTKESGTFGKGQSYRVQFNETGTYTFHDHLNPKISIVVVVYEQKQK